VALFTARGLGKRYVVRPDRAAAFARRAKARDLWALRGLSLDVEAGELVSVIGRNGAGKSTFLKLAAGVVTPTEGDLHRPRRVAPLIEVGAGFHPELSGRENIEVNGRLLGLSANQVRKRFDEIVAFSDLARAIDQPVKQYSSGMYMRLGFAVAVHTEPELLIVDEVLAVGDVLFQVRCVERIKAMRREGTAILFVSHNLPTVLTLSDWAVLLDHGREAGRGDPRDVVSAYHALMQNAEEPLTPDGVPLPLGVTDVAVRGADGERRTLWQPGDTVHVSVTVTARADTPGGTVELRLGKEGGPLAAAWHGGPEHRVPPLRQGESRTVGVTLDLNLSEGGYLLALVVRDDLGNAALEAEVCRFGVEPRPGADASGVADLAPRMRVAAR
jgi:ABC-type polysaccharide/polyol phosphate transport system ATPase subunit